MASIERTAYPRFKRQFTAKELTLIYTPNKNEIAFAYATTKGESNILNILCLLKSFQRLGYFPSLTDIPAKIVNHIRSNLKLADDIVLGYENRKTMYRHRTAIREYLQINPFNQKGLHIAIKAVNESATIMDNPADLMNIAIAELVKARYELPGFNTLNRLVRRVRNLVNQRLFGLVLSRISSDYQQRLLDLLERHPLESQTAFNNLKQLPKSPNRNNINDFIIHSTWLDSLGDVKLILQDITTAKIHHFAAEARVLDAHEIKEFTLSKRITLILCLIYSAQVNARDSLVEMFLKQMRSINNDAQKELELIKKRIQETQEKLVGVLTNVLHVFQGFVDENQLAHEQASSHPEIEVSDSDDSQEQAQTSKFNLPLEQISTLNLSPEQTSEINFYTELLKIQGESLFTKLNNVFTQDGGAEKLLLECEAINAYRGNNHLPLLWKFYKNHRSTFFRLVKALDLKSTTNEQSVIEALKFVIENSHRRGEFLKASIELDFISEQWRKLVVVKHGEKTKFVRRHFEVCVFYYLAAELRSGDICVIGSEDYADYREQLLPWSECLPLVDQYCENLDFPNTAAGFALAHMLGIKLMPRIRNWKDLNFYRPDKETVYQNIDSLFSETVNWQRIETHWQDILQVVLSIQTGKISSAILLRKLGNYSRKNRLYQAFQELGQVVRTVFLLQYISDMQLRKEITAVTNIVEAYHKFSKWFFFGGFGVVMKNDPIEQEKVIKYKDLVANAVLFQNVVDLTDILRDLQKQGYLVEREDVAVVSPYITAHVKRFGDYLIDMDTIPPSLDELEKLVLV